MPKSTTKTFTIIRRITRFGRKPKTPAQAFKQAYRLLDEERRYTTGEWFADGDPQDVLESTRDEAACGSWGACLMGAIGLVTGEMPVKVEVAYDADGEIEEARWNDDRWGIYEKGSLMKVCHTILSKHLIMTRNFDAGPESWNDRGDRQAVLDLLDEVMALDVAKVPVR